MKKVMDVKDIRFSYNNDRDIFKDVSFSIEAGQVISIIGPNGAGKSTLLNCLAGLCPVSGGEIQIGDQPISAMKPKEIAQHIGYVPQSHIPAYSYTVRDFVVMGRAPHISMMRSPGDEDYDIADEAIKAMGIEYLADRPYTEISGGERQQATIARVMVQRPKLIMMDEPTAHLDYGNQMRTIALIKKLSKEGYAVIMTTHMPDHAIMLGDTAAVLDRTGRLLTGNTTDIIKEKTMSEIYGTELKLVYVPEAGRDACIAVLKETE